MQFPVLKDMLFWTGVHSPYTPHRSFDEGLQNVHRIGHNSTLLEA